MPQPQRLRLAGGRLKKQVKARNHTALATRQRESDGWIRVKGGLVSGGQGRASPARTRPTAAPVRPWRRLQPETLEQRKVAVATSFGSSPVRSESRRGWPLLKQKS